MNIPDKTFRKTNPLLGIVLAIAFVALGYYLYFNVAEQPDASYPMLTKIIGAAAMAFFGGLLLFALYKILTKKTT